MAFHKRQSSNVQFAQLNLKEGNISVPIGVENGVKLFDTFESTSGYITRIDIRKNESAEYGLSESLTMYFHDSTSLSFNFANNGNVNYTAAHLIARLLSVAGSEPGFSNEVVIRAGVLPAGHKFPDGKVLEKDRVWTSVRVPALSNDPIPPYYGKDTNGQPLDKLPETPPLVGQNGHPLMHQNRPVRDHTMLKAWVDGAVGFLKQRAEQTAEINRQKAPKPNESTDDAGIDPAAIAAAEVAAQAARQQTTHYQAAPAQAQQAHQAHQAQPHQQPNGGYGQAHTAQATQPATGYQAAPEQVQQRGPAVRF